MSEFPTITVLMSFYNDASFIGEAVESIVKQTRSDFELLMINDGSTDESLAIVQAFHDERIRIVSNERNLGLTASLQRGIPLARGKYIARMDADDIAEPDRLAIQGDFLEKNPDIGIVGSTCQLFREDGQTIGLYPVPFDSLAIRWTSLLNNPFAHPTVFIRHDLLDRYALTYDTAFTTAQDYELWTRLLDRTRGANLEKPLVRYRLREGVTARKREEQLKNHDFIAYRTIRSILPDFPITPEQVTRMRSLLITENFFDETGTLKVAELEEAIALYLAMLSAFLDLHAGEPEKNRLKWREIYKISRLLYRLSKRSGFDAVLVPQLRSLTRLLWK